MTLYTATVNLDKQCASAGDARGRSRTSPEPVRDPVSRSPPVAQVKLATQISNTSLQRRCNHLDHILGLLRIHYIDSSAGLSEIDKFNYL